MGQGDRVGAEPRKGRQGKMSYRRVGTIATAGQLGKDVTNNMKANSMGLAIPVSSPKPQMASQQISNETADMLVSNTTSARPAEPTGMLSNPPDNLLEL